MENVIVSRRMLVTVENILKLTMKMKVLSRKEIST